MKLIPGFLICVMAGILFGLGVAFAVVGCGASTPTPKRMPAITQIRNPGFSFMARAYAGGVRGTRALAGEPEGRVPAGEDE